MSDALPILRRSRVFAGLSDPDAMTLFDAGRLANIRSGANLITAGQPPDGFWVVVRGRFHVLSPEHGAAIAEIGPGEPVGEMGLVTLEPRGADVVAVEASVAWHLPGRGFELLLQQGDPLAVSILLGVSKDLCRRFRESILDGAAMVPGLMRYPEGRALIESQGWEVL